MSRFTYTGPNSAVTLKVSDGAGGLKDQDVVLWNGQEVDLPADHEMVVALRAQGYLEPVNAVPASQETSAGSDPKTAPVASGKTK